MSDSTRKKHRSKLHVVQGTERDFVCKQRQLIMEPFAQVDRDQRHAFYMKRHSSAFSRLTTGQRAVTLTRYIEFLQVCNRKQWLNTARESLQRLANHVAGLRVSVTPVVEVARPWHAAFSDFNSQSGMAIARVMRGITFEDYTPKAACEVLPTLYQLRETVDGLVSALENIASRFESEA